MILRFVVWPIIISVTISGSYYVIDQTLKRFNSMDRDIQLLIGSLERDIQQLIGSLGRDIQQLIGSLDRDSQPVRSAKNINSSSGIEEKPKPPEKKQQAMIDAPIVSQYPELRNGCEVVSLTMLLQFYGIEKDKLALAQEMKKDTTPRKEVNGNTVYWGNPNIGFVGDVTGKTMGYGIYNGPLLELLSKYIPNGINLTGSSFDEIERSVSEGRPVVVWTTVSFTKPREDQWVTWQSPQGEVRATFQEHAVLVVGYDEDHVYVNDPISGKKKLQLEKSSFLASWEALGKQAISYAAKPI